VSRHKNPFELRGSMQSDNWRPRLEQIFTCTTGGWSRRPRASRSIASLVLGRGKPCWSTTISRYQGGRRRLVAWVCRRNTSSTTTGCSGPIGRPRTPALSFIVAPTLIDHGTQDQRDRFLTPVPRAEELWCQGFSEPGRRQRSGVTIYHGSAQEARRRNRRPPGERAEALDHDG
jgi:hypothetical protein